MSLSPAIFFDKDGTLVVDRAYNVDPKLIELAPGATEALGRLSETGHRMVIITNQSGVAMGYFKEGDLAPIESALAQVFEGAGARLDGFFYCPHHPDGALSSYRVECECRKPKPGLIQRASEHLGLDLQRSWFVGDILHDVEAGRRVGCRTILIDNGNETEWSLSPMRVPHFLAKDLREAAEIILKEWS